MVALLLTLATPSGSRLAKDQPHVGFGAFLAERDHAYLVDDIGFNWLVWPLQWSGAEPFEGVYDWQGLDELLDAAETLGLKVILRVDTAPEWAITPGGEGPPYKLEEFADFMFALASHCAGRVSGYVIWN